MQIKKCIVQKFIYFFKIYLILKNPGFSINNFMLFSFAYNKPFNDLMIGSLFVINNFSNLSGLFTLFFHII